MSNEETLHTVQGKVQSHNLSENRCTGQLHYGCTYIKFRSLSVLASSLLPCHWFTAGINRYLLVPQTVLLHLSGLFS